MEIIAMIPPMLLVSSSPPSRPRCSPHRTLMSYLAMCAASNLPQQGRDARVIEM